MIRTLALATFATAFAMPALAENTATKSTGDATINAAFLAQEASQKQAFQHLARQGYVNIALTERDDHGRWVGTAYKDGRTVIVAVDLPRVPAQAITN